MRPVRQAEKAELISVARAMNDDFAPKVQRLFNSEVQAAQNALQTGNFLKTAATKIKHYFYLQDYTSVTDVQHSLGIA
jgi:hypothetical protein